MAEQLREAWAAGRNPAAGADGAVELEAVADRLARLIRDSQCESHQQICSLLRDQQAHLDARLAEANAHLAALRAQVAEVKGEQTEQRAVLNEHGQAIARIETRLADGDRRFGEQEERLGRLETASGSQRARLARLAAGVGQLTAAASLGGAVSASVLKLLGS